MCVNVCVDRRRVKVEAGRGGQGAIHFYRGYFRTHSLAHSLTHSLALSLTCSLTYSLACSLTRLLTHLLIRLLAHPHPTTHTMCRPRVRVGPADGGDGGDGGHVFVQANQFMRDLRSLRSGFLSAQHGVRGTSPLVLSPYC
jgi:GTP1/OBG